MSLPNRPDRQDVIARVLAGSLVPGRSYHTPLPDEVALWYCYISGEGHSILVTLAADGHPVEDNLVPAPVKAVLRAGWQIIDGYVVTDLPYDWGGLVTDPSDIETEPATDTVHHILVVGQPFNPRITSWPDGAAELRLLPENVDLVQFISSPTPEEIKAVSKGTAEFALVAADHYLLVAYRFINERKGGNPLTPSSGLPWSDAPWEYHRQLQAGPVQVPGEPGTPFALNVVLVDAINGNIASLRRVTVPVEFADALRAAVTQQARLPHDPQAAKQGIEAVYRRYDSASLARLADARFEAAKGD